MKEINFRIIELSEHQVLLMKDFDEEEDDKPLLVITFFLDGVKLNLKLGYDTDSRRDDAFLSFTEEQAASFINTLI